MYLAKNLEKLIADHGLNTLELSRRTGVGQPVIYRIMTGETDNPKIGTVCILADYFGITVNQLVREAPMPMKTSEHAKPETAQGIPLLTWEDIMNWLGRKNKPSGYTIPAADLMPTDHMYAVKLYDDSMEPVFARNTILIIEGEKMPKNSSYAIVKQRGQDRPIFRQILIEGDRHYLRPLHPSTERYKIQLFGNQDKYGGTLVQARRNY